ncbi:hypothetical protein PROFUN_07325 [Planoprotostelium fungivorum]|uniref:Uncharacterized protein n=1 Tax=Planoprotostelium fungivorum TaxID=1890364 RepID=A0A2P6NM48_9EUKA|nr:hypothetical protein PROFUN_07325 [Planoprotostelium fungivorum]
MAKLKDIVVVCTQCGVNGFNLGCDIVKGDNLARIGSQNGLGQFCGRFTTQSMTTKNGGRIAVVSPPTERIDIPSNVKLLDGI